LLPETRRILTGLPATVDVDQIDASIQSMRMRAKGGDTESLFRLAMLLISRGTTVGSWSDIEEAESLLQRSSEEGHSEAREFLLNTWPEIKGGYLKAR
jgi:TPR repeat protein